VSDTARSIYPVVGKDERRELMREGSLYREVYLTSGHDTVRLLLLI